MAIGGVDTRQIAALDSILERLGVAVQRLGDLMPAVREAAVGDSPERLLEAVSLVEAAAAQIGRLEEERQDVQRGLERALGVTGLAAVAARCRSVDGVAPLEARVARMQHQVQLLQDEQARTAALLTSAIAIAQRMGGYVARLRGVDSPYRPRPELVMGALTLGHPDPTSSTSHHGPTAAICHPEPAGEGSLARDDVAGGERSFAALRMTEAEGVSFAALRMAPDAALGMTDPGAVS